VNAEHGREFTAGGNAVALAQIARVHEGAQLVAKLDVKRNVTLWLEMKWKHCLSPSANSTRYWPVARANLSFAEGFAPPVDSEVIGVTPIKEESRSPILVHLRTRVFELEHPCGPWPNACLSFYGA